MNEVLDSDRDTSYDRLFDGKADRELAAAANVAEQVKGKRVKALTKS